MDRAVREVFEPGAERVHRTVGHPEAPMRSESVVELIRARMRTAERLAAGEVTDAEFVQARQAHPVAYAQYALGQAR